jgi:hypothetical protein
LEIPHAANYLGFEAQKDKVNKRTYAVTILADVYDAGRSEIEQRKKETDAGEKDCLYLFERKSFGRFSIIISLCFGFTNSSPDRAKRSGLANSTVDTPQRRVYSSTRSRK